MLLSEKCNKQMGAVTGSSGEGNGDSLQYSCLEKSMDRGAWLATERGAAKEWDTT